MTTVHGPSHPKPIVQEKYGAVVFFVCFSIYVLPLFALIFAFIASGDFTAGNRVHRFILWFVANQDESFGTDHRILTAIAGLLATFASKELKVWQIIGILALFTVTFSASALMDSYLTFPDVRESLLISDIFSVDDNGSQVDYAAKTSSLIGRIRAYISQVQQATLMILMVGVGSKFVGPRRND